MKWKFRYRSSQLAHTENMGATIRIGTILRSVLNTRGLSLKTVSAATGIPYSTLHTWLENRQPKDIVKVKKLADYLEVDLTELLFGEPLLGAKDQEMRLPGHDQVIGVYEVTIRRKETP